MADVPRMPAAAVEKLREVLRRSGDYLEYGSGGSTILALSGAACRVVSVESDARYLAAVTRKAAGFEARFTPLYADIGVTTRWGWPISAGSSDRWPDYARLPWRHLAAEGVFPDSILFDGRFRVACVLESLLRLGTRTCLLMLDDYSLRPSYHVLESEGFVTRVEMADRMLVAKRADGFDPAKAGALLERSFMDPR
ncbi:MAG: hypothetical protein HYZ75_19290 [Elusimicrobia bacterium]|nr:hypothetical protein [Elusimicrobiota bacterium]